MRLLLGSCAVAALLVGGSSCAMAQTAVGDAPIHAIPASDSQPGQLINGPPVPAPAQGQVVEPQPELPPAPAPGEAPPRPLQLADASPMPGASAASEKSLIASLTPPPVVQPIVLAQDEAAFFTALGRRVTDSATAYDGYVRHAAAIDPGFNDPGAVQLAVRVAADYQPEQLQQGIVAYAAMIALRSPAFVDGVRAQAQADPAFADRLSVQPWAILRVPGAAQAAMDVAGVLRAHGVALQSAGRAIGKAAYDIQAQPWSKQPVANPVEVLAGVKASATQPRAADAPSEKMLLQSLVSAPRGEASGPPSATPVVVRGMAVAALAVMGRAGDKEDLRVATLLQDALSADCLKLAMMNMNQCLAAAGPHYDDVFCVGEHGVGETARCVSTAADGPGSVEADPGLRVASVQGPDGRSYGPEAAAAYGYGPRPSPSAAATPPPADTPQPAPPPYAPATYADQGPPPAQPAQRVPTGYGYPYGPPGGGYAPYDGYDAQSPAYDPRGYPTR